MVKSVFGKAPIPPSVIINQTLIPSPDKKEKPDKEEKLDPPRRPLSAPLPNTKKDKI